MSHALRTELRDQGRAVVGALTVVGVTFIFTMETWWLGWQLPITTLLIYDAVGLALVLATTRLIGFRREDEREGESATRSRSSTPRILTDFAELLFQSFITAYATLFLFGIINWGDPAIEIVRLGLMLVVPLAFGAALVNELLTGATNQEELEFPRNLATFTVGAIFLASTIAPTQEVELMAAHAGWWRMAFIVLASIGITYVMLYELELKGQGGRVQGQGMGYLLGTSVMVYVLSFVVTAALLAAFGHFSNAPFEVWVQETIVIGFPATIGASAAEVII